MDKIREKLNWEPGFLNGNGCKPKGMHWKTFEHLQKEHDVYAKKSTSATSSYLKNNNLT